MQHEMSNSFSHPCDSAERGMVYKILSAVMCLQKTSDNIEKAYDFIESDVGGVLWERYYNWFATHDYSFVGPVDKRKYKFFVRTGKVMFREWEKGLINQRVTKNFAVNRSPR